MSFKKSWWSLLRANCFGQTVQLYQKIKLKLLTQMARLEVAYENQSSRFYRQDQNFQRQFFHIYESRLKQLGDLLRQKVATKYGEKQLITQPVLNL